MPDDAEITSLQEQLVAHRRTLATLLAQHATFTSAYAPPQLVAGIAEARAGIQRCKASLRGWNLDVADHLDDDERPMTSDHRLVPVPPTTSPTIARLTLLIEGDVQQFTPEQQVGFVFVLARVVNVSPDQIRIVRLDAGSVKLTLDLPADAAERFVALYAAADPSLEPLHLLNIELQSDEVRNDPLQIARDTTVAEEVRAASIEALARSERAMDLLALALDVTVDAALRLRAAKALGKVGQGKEAPPILLSLADDATVAAKVRVRAAEALAQLGRAAESIPLLLELAGDPTVELWERLRAATALVNDATVPEEIREAAMEALNQLKEVKPRGSR